MQFLDGFQVSKYFLFRILCFHNDTFSRKLYSFSTINDPNTKASKCMLSKQIILSTVNTNTIKVLSRNNTVIKFYKHLQFFCNIFKKFYRCYVQILFICYPVMMRLIILPDSTLTRISLDWLEAIPSMDANLKLIQIQYAESYQLSNRDNRRTKFAQQQ